jgi:hypothetical protein
MGQSLISGYHPSVPTLSSLPERARSCAVLSARGVSARGSLTPCLGLAALGSLALWAGIASIGALLVA